MTEMGDLAELDGGPLHTDPSLFTYIKKGLEISPNGTAAIVTHQSADHLSELFSGENLTGPDDHHGECLAWTYTQLHEAALKLAGGLQAKKIDSGKTIATFIPNGIEWLLLLWTATLVKVPLASLDYSCLHAGRNAELQAFLETCKPDLVVVPDLEGAERVKSAVSDLGMAQPHVILLESKTTKDPRTLLQVASAVTLDSASKTSIATYALDDDPSRICLTFFTSGTSSGKPKGCPRDVASMTHYINTAKWGPHSASSRFLLQSMNFRIILPTIALTAWQKGATLVVPGPTFTPTSSLDALERHRVTHAQFVPATMNAITRDPSFASRDLSALQVFLVCGDIVTRSNLQHAQRAFPSACVMTLYGMTEGGGWLVWPFASTPIDQIPYLGDVSPVGVIAPGARLRIWDVDRGCVVRRGETGEIQTCSRGAIKGYLGGVNAEAFLDDGQRRWFRTGDIGTVDGQGVVYIVSRLKDVIKRAGISVTPAGLENCIDEFTGSQVRLAFALSSS